MKELTCNEVRSVSGGGKTTKFLFDALIGGLLGGLSGCLGGPAGCATGFAIGVITIMTTDIASEKYDAHMAAANATAQQRQIELQQQNNDLIYFTNV
jgi:hypothetical protein